MSVDLSTCSIAQWFAEREQHKCGYCKSPSGSVSYGMYTEQLNVEQYKDLIDRGWRRSGKYCYKPTMDTTCCPQYTIKCDTMQFSLNKSHKKILKKLNKFLNDGIFNKNVPPSDLRDDEVVNDISGYNKQSTINLSKSITTTEDNFCHLKTEKPQDKAVSQGISAQQSSENGVKGCSEINAIRDSLSDIPNSSNSKSTKKQLKDGEGPDPNKPPCKKAKILRLERKKEKLLQKGQAFIESTNKINNSQKTLSQFIEEVPSTAKHKLKVVLVRMNVSHEHFGASAELYRKYQMTIHNEPSAVCRPSSYIDFLVDTPLKYKPFPNGIEGPGYGSFHQQYWLDDKLIAVGVIDILPGCVSSVYFFYDPDYRDLTLGTYGSLREIQLVQNLQLKIPDLKYYYMGFYIHSCPKMRYKGKLNPSELLCPETYVWIPIERCLGKLDVSKYSRLNETIDAVDTNNCNRNDIDTIKVVNEHKLMYVKDYVRVYGGDREMFENLGNLVGKRSAHSIIFWMG